MRRLALLGAGLAAVLAAQPASALSLDEAVALARKTNPDLAQARAQADLAAAKLSEAQAQRLPSLTLSGETGQGSVDLGGFFGFG
ncbi:MAG TPA: TolC family protein, partial [Phenylobacterium sp.]|nr:TolC family protein [Phenylobacterium sp.]